MPGPHCGSRLPSEQSLECSASKQSKRGLLGSVLGEVCGVLIRRIAVALAASVRELPLDIVRHPGHE